MFNRIKLALVAASGVLVSALAATAYSSPPPLFYTPMYQWTFYEDASMTTLAGVGVDRCFQPFSPTTQIIWGQQTPYYTKGFYAYCGREGGDEPL